MKSRLATSFGGVANREKKHLGKKASEYEIPEHPGRGLVRRSWVGWLLGLVPLGYPGGGLTGHPWVGWLLGLTP